MVRLLSLILCAAALFGGEIGEARSSGGGWLASLASFVQWPDAARHGPLIVGVAGSELREGPVGGLGDARGRALLVRRVSTVEEMRRCHVVVLGRSFGLGLRAVVRELEGAPALTVSDAPGFSQIGGMVELRAETPGRLFTLNAGAARRSGLSFRPSLLSVAQVTRSEEAAE